MKTYSKAIVLFLTAVLSAAAVSCSRYGRNEAQSTEFATFIKSHTSGIISDKSTIKIEMASSIPEAEPGADLKDGILTFSPAIKGTARWISTSTIEFIPVSGELKSGVSYTAKLQVDKIQKVAGRNFRKFTFKFLVAIKEAVLHHGHITTTAASPEVASVDGTISLTEELPLETVQSMLVFDYPVEGAEASVTAGDDPLHFNYEIVALQRAEKDRVLKIKLKSGSTGFLTESKIDVVIPHTEEFKITEARLVESDDTYLSISFSDALDETADYTGLFMLEGVGTTYQQVKDNMVKIFFDVPSDVPVTLTVSGDVKSHSGIRLGEDFTKRFSFQKEKPAVEIKVTGNILPDSKNLILPFRAVHLKAVDVRVVQIYQENVLMFLQDNNLDGGNSLRRSGRLVCKRRLHLDSDPSKDLHKWQDYSIDLSRMFRQEPGAIYRVMISFKQEYSVYGKHEDFRSGTPSNELTDIAAEDITEEDDDEWDRPQPYWYDDFFDWEKYSWQDRDNPLKPSYYMDSGRFPSINLLTSNLGVIAEYAGGDRLWVSVSDILSSAPVFNAELYVYSYQLREIGYAKTDTEGMAEIQLSGKPFAVVAKRGGSTSYLKVSEGNEKSLSRFDVGGKTLEKGLKAFIYGERGVWRPGDNLHLTMMLEDKEDRIPDDHPVSMEIYSPQGQFYTKLINSNGRDGVYVFDVPTRADDPTGTWHAYFKVGGATFHKSLMIESIKPNRLKINLDLGPEAIDGGTSTDLGLTSEWLTGSPAANLKANVRMTLRRGGSTFKGFEGYDFTNPLSEYSASEYNLLDSRLGPDGHASARVEMPAAEGAPGMLSAEILTSVQEEGGDISFSTMVLPFSPYSSYVGINVPVKGEGDWLEADRDYALKVATVDKEGRRVQGVNLTYSIYKLKWSWWWESRAEDLDSYVNSPSAEPVATGTMVSGKNDSTVPFRVDYPEWGRYLVIVKDNDSGHTCGKVLYVDWPESRGRASKADPDALTMLTFSTDKEKYNVGDIVKVYIPSARKGHALISLENSREVLSRTWVKANGGQDVEYSFTVTPEMAPNFYVHVTLLQPHERVDNDLPIRLYGVRPVMVDNKESHLEPVISMPDVLRPEQEFTVKVKEKNGRPMTYTLAIVDEGLLDLTNFKTPDPWKSMYEREALGVSTWDLYDDIIGAWSGRFSPMFSIGGDETLVRGSKKDNRFNPVVMFEGPYTLQTGSASHKMKLPMYVGSVRVMVIAAKDASYGSTEKTVPVKSPLMTLTSLPRALSEGEKVTMPVNIFVLEDGVKDAKVTVTTEGPLKVVGDASATAHFDRTGDQIVRFSLEAAGTGTAKVDITAEGGGRTSHETVTIDVNRANPPVLTNTTLSLKKGETKSFTFTPFTGSDGNWAELELSNCPSINSDMVFLKMSDYPYRCTEQIAAMGMTLLSIRESLSENKQKTVDKAIPELVQLICQRQRPDGGFALWNDSPDSQSWISSMAGEFLMNASRSGASVSRGVLASWSRYQKRAVQDYRNSDSRFLWDLEQAYRLYTLALNGETESGAMNRLKEAQGLSSQARWMLASAYSLSGKKAVAQEILSSLKPEFNAYMEKDGTYGSPLRDKSIALESYVLTDMTDKAFEIAQDVAREVSGEMFSSQEIAFAIKAMRALAEKAGSGMLSANVTSGSKSMPVTSVKSSAKVSVDPENGKVDIENNSEGMIHAHLTLSNVPDPDTRVDARADGVSIKVAYKGRDGKEINPKEIAQGTEFSAVVTVNNGSSLKSLDDLALLMKIPSGWEAVNERLFTGAGEGQDKVEHLDLRDDRCIWHFSLPKSSFMTFTLRLKAAYEGEFVLPSVKCEALYDPHTFACTASSTTKVTR